MNRAQAERPIAPKKDGSTKPYIIQCDGEEYIVKFKQNPEREKALVNEYVCAKLADLMNLPLASPTLIDVDQVFVEDHGGQIAKHVEDNIQSGVHFGTKKVPKVFPLNKTNIVDEACNKEIIPDLLFFDQLICNEDRDSNAGNLLFDYERMRLVVIDHTHAFDLGPIWDEHQLKRRIGDEFVPFNRDGYIYSKLFPFVSHSNDVFDECLEKMKNFSIDTIHGIMNNIPLSWNVKDEEKEMMCTYIMDRVSRSDEIAECLMSSLKRERR